MSEARRDTVLRTHVHYDGNISETDEEARGVTNVIVGSGAWLGLSGMPGLATAQIPSDLKWLIVFPRAHVNMRATPKSIVSDLGDYLPSLHSIADCHTDALNMGKHNSHSVVPKKYYATRGGAPKLPWEVCLGINEHALDDCIEWS